MPQRVELWLLEALAPTCIDALEECLCTGTLRASNGGVEFRHELARRAVEESIEPRRAAGLHRLAVVALEQPPVGAPDAARLAHHAEAAAKPSPCCATRSPRPSAPRRSVRIARRPSSTRGPFASRTASPTRNAPSLLERQSDSLYNTDEQAQAITALEAAIELHRRAGNVRAEAVDLARIVPMLTCRGLLREAEEAAATALRLLEPLPPGPEHAAVYQAAARARFIEDDFAGRDLLAQTRVNA